MTYQFQNASILVVDDMKPMLHLAVSILKTFGFQHIYQARDADEAFIKFCRFNPDIVLTDWMMGPYDGIELTDKIRNDPKSPNKFVPVILMTGYSARIRVMESRDKGVTEFLVKPFSAKDLYMRIEQLIEKPRKFVDTKQFFGPDRRRKKGDDYVGPRRRTVDAGNSPKTGDEVRIQNILKKLRQEASERTKSS
ncbi:MAG TPA: response regulator [Micavibrio sp.]|jgi:CheY-like chemotaxis protein